MRNIVGVVEVDSTLPAVEGNAQRSLADRKLGGRSILDWVVRRVTDSQRLNQVVLVADSRDPRKRLISDLTPSDVPIYFGRQADALGRLAAVAKKYHADAIVRVSVDHPFVDPTLIDRLTRVADQTDDCEYVSYGTSTTCHPVVSSMGLFAEWCRTDAIVRADRDATSLADRRESTRFIYTHPELFQLLILPTPQALDRDDLRLAVRSEDDWDHAQAIYDALGPEGLDWQGIAGLLTHQPEIRRRMAVLNRSDVL